MLQNASFLPKNASKSRLFFKQLLQNFDLKTIRGDSPQPKLYVEFFGECFKSRTCTLQPDIVTEQIPGTQNQATKSTSMIVLKSGGTAGLPKQRSLSDKPTGELLLVGVSIYSPKIGIYLAPR